MKPQLHMLSGMLRTTNVVKIQTIISIYNWVQYRYKLDNLGLYFHIQDANW